MKFIHLLDDITKESTVGAAYVGSISHGTFRPSTEETSIDDKDVMLVVVPPIEYYFGMEEYGSRGTKVFKEGEWDIVSYEFRKFVRLLEKGNPNVLGLLWMPENMYIKRDEPFQSLIDARHMFVGKHVYKSFTGYAYGQLHRMTHYKRDEISEIEIELRKRSIDPEGIK